MNDDEIRKQSRILKRDLYSQLKNKGIDTKFLKSTIDSLIWLWEKEKEMQADVDENGRLISSISAQGKAYERDNPAVKDILNYSKQILAIIKELGLTTDAIKPGKGAGVVEM